MICLKRGRWTPLIMSLILGLAAAGMAQETQPAAQQPAAPNTPSAAPTAAAPPIDDLHGISLGMTVDQVKQKLGKPDTSDDVSLYYDLDHGESMQIQLDADKKVRTAAAIYSGREAKAPDFADIMGPDVPLIKKENGSIYKQVRYPSDGYWVSYSKVDLDSGPMTVVTMQKIPGH